MIDPVEFGKAMGEIVREALAPWQKRVEELEAMLPQKGDPGPQGEPGADAEPVLVADVVAELVKSDVLAPVLDLYVEERVAKHFEANPVQHGRDGKDGDQGPKGDHGDRGEKGADGLDVKDLFRADGGRLMAVMSDGTTKDLGQFVGKDGEAGKDGRDGLGFEDAEASVADGMVTLTFKRGDLCKSVSYPAPQMAHIGFWQTGMSAKTLQTTTHDGSLWIALRDTKEAPSYQSKDWQLAARKGRDGTDGKSPPKAGPVKLKGDGDA